MLLALLVATALEAVPLASPTVELKRTEKTGASVSAAPRSLSDVARELREGRRATGGFSAVETTVPRYPVDLRFVEWEEEEDRGEPEVVPEPQPPEIVSNEIYGWGGGGWATVPPRHRPPHVGHFGKSEGRHQAHAAPRRAAPSLTAPVRSGSSRSVAAPAHPYAGPRATPGSVGRRPL
jgi:hypothetical protein